MVMKKAQKVVDKFIELFNTTPLVVQAPGRINLIGEHVDYNLGTVLPATINKRIYLAISERTDTEVHIVSSDFDDRFSTNLDSLSSAKLWPQYVLGPMSEIQKRVTFLNGFNIVFGGDIPLSAGLSSSAALTVAVTFA